MPASRNNSNTGGCANQHDSLTKTTLTSSVSLHLSHRNQHDLQTRDLQPNKTTEKRIKETSSRRCETLPQADEPVTSEVAPINTALPIKISLIDSDPSFRWHLSHRPTSKRRGYKTREIETEIETIFSERYCMPASKHTQRPEVAPINGIHTEEENTDRLRNSPSSISPASHYRRSKIAGTEKDEDTKGLEYHLLGKWRSSASRFTRTPKLSPTNKINSEKKIRSLETKCPSFSTQFGCFA